MFPLIPLTAAEGVRAFFSANDVVEFLAAVFPSMILKGKNQTKRIIVANCFLIVGVAKSRLLERLQAKHELELKGLASGKLC